MDILHADVRLAVDTLAELGESPVWHPIEQVLYYCDIPAHRLYRFDPRTSDLVHWQFDTDVAACAPMARGGLLLALRTGLWHFKPESGQCEPLVAPPYDPANERFNDGKCDPSGRFWVSTIYEPRDQPAAALYCWQASALQRAFGGLTVGNGLAWSPDGSRMYWSDTTSHTVFVADRDASSGGYAQAQTFARFERRTPQGALSDYGGRPDGAAVDAEGCYWVAMFEGQRLLRLSPQGKILCTVPLPVRCPTMPCFGGSDLRTLYVTTARHRRPQEELAQQPWAGGVLAISVEVPGLPATLVEA